MNDRALRIYLQDHLAGSVLGIRLAKNCEAEGRPTEVSRFLSTLVPEIEADQRMLEEVIDRVGGRPSRAMRAAAWLVERISLWKLNLTSRTYPDLKRFEQLEGLLLGIRGKQALWHALEKLQDDRLTGIDFETLGRKASGQLDRIEGHRLEAASSAFRNGACADDRRFRGG